MASELDKVFQARNLKQTENGNNTNGDSKPTKPSPLTKKPPGLKPGAKPVPGSKPSGVKPLPPKKPNLLPKPKVASKIEAALTQTPNKPLPKPKPPSKPVLSKPVLSKPGDGVEFKPKPGAAALASVLQGAVSKKPIEKTSISGLDSDLRGTRLEKTQSVDLSKPRSVSDLSNHSNRPHSSSIDEDFFSESPRARASPVVTPNSSPSSQKKRFSSLSPAKSVDSPLAVHSPSRALSSSLDHSTESEASLDRSSVEPEASRFDRASSLPRDTSLTSSDREKTGTKQVSPIKIVPTNNLFVQSRNLKARSTSDIRKVDRRAPPPPPSKPSTKTKSSSKLPPPPKPSPYKSPETKKRSNSAPIEEDSEAHDSRPIKDAVSKPNSPDNHTQTLPPRLPPPKCPSSPMANSDSPSPISPASLRNRDTPTPDSPAGSVKALSEMFSGSPKIRVIASSVSESTSGSPGLKQKRGVKTDSGFGSEGVDEVTIAAGASVESLPEEREPSPSPPAATSVTTEIWGQERLDKARSKRHNIALELLSTEKTYVERMKCIAVDFFELVTEFNVKHKQAIPQAAVQLIFLNIQPIYQLNENILTELQKRMDTWDTHEGLGDVIARLAPFLKLYTTYTSGFEDAMKTLTDWTKKDKKFDSLIREFERDVLATGLGVAHYMLEPVQRIPRYRLLLADYLKYLPPDSPDRLDTTKALGIISQAADRTNNRIKELENSNEILAIHRSLTDYEGSLVAPSRVFLKKGELEKSSRKKETPRMFFLFSDMLLHTKPSGTGTFEFKDEMPIFGMRVEVPKVSLVPHSFNVHSTSRALILVAKSEEEKVAWMTTLKEVISDDMKKRSSLRRDLNPLPSQSSVDSASSEFGTVPPIMVPDKSVTMCQTCTAPFTLTFRRHHCRACGKVVCGPCSQSKTYLTYMDKMERVCIRCFQLAKGLTDESDGQNSPAPVKKSETLPAPGSGVLNLKALEDDAVIAAYVLSQDGRNWKKLWYQVKTDFVLYKFKAHEDIKAIHSMPLPGYKVTPDRDNSVINLIHPSSKKQLCDCFKVEDSVAFESWVAALNKVVCMELPKTSVISPTSNRSSFIDSFDLSSSSRPTSALNSGEESNSANCSRSGSFTQNNSGSLSPVNS